TVRPQHRQPREPPAQAHRKGPNTARHHQDGMGQRLHARRPGRARRMSKVLRFLWPRTLAGRLTLFLVLALAVAQAGLALLLNSQRDELVSSLTHNQSLNQTVTLARLLDSAAPAD